MDITFEVPTVADAKDLVAVQVRAFHDDARLYPGVEIGGPPGYDSLESMIEDIQKYLCHKIVHQGKVIGGIVVFDWGDGHYHLDRLFVEPSYHNKGVGTQSMQFLEATYSARLWTLDTPVYATRNQHFYEKMGYVKTGTKDSDDVPLVSYKKGTTPITSSRLA
jgi:GNAT superfamily N-acetyltransferase